MSDKITPDDWDEFSRALQDDLRGKVQKAMALLESLETMGVKNFGAVAELIKFMEHIVSVIDACDEQAIRAALDKLYEEPE